MRLVRHGSRRFDVEAAIVAGTLVLGIISMLIVISLGIPTSGAAGVFTVASFAYMVAVIVNATMFLRQ